MQAKHRRFRQGMIHDHSVLSGVIKERCGAGLLRLCFERNWSAAALRATGLACLTVWLASATGCSPLDGPPDLGDNLSITPTPSGKTETPSAYPSTSPTPMTTLVGRGSRIRPAVATTYRFRIDEPGTVHVTTRWYDGDIVLSLTSPSGRVIDRDTTAADVTHELGPTFESYDVTTPEPGTWTLTLFGARVSPEGAVAWLDVHQEDTPDIGPVITVEQSFEGRTVSLEATATPGPGRRIVEYLWEFGDGARVRGPTARTVRHTYTEPGEYLVSVAVQDDHGYWGVDAAPATVTVE